MTNYGFIVDNRKCIGCHACTTACKQENEVPLSVNRTWVKTVETGHYPDTQRHFQVTRCNHCANPPCVRICPVSAMYQRKDGIVEFDPSICIGCKACLQACPYDAITSTQRTARRPSVTIAPTESKSASNRPVWWSAQNTRLSLATWTIQPAKSAVCWRGRA